MRTSQVQLKSARRRYVHRRTQLNMAPKAAPKAKAQARPVLRPRNGQPCRRGLQGATAKRAWLQMVGNNFARGPRTANTTQAVRPSTARLCAEWFLHHHDYMPKMLPILVLYRADSLVQIVLHFKARRMASWQSVNRAVEHRRLSDLNLMPNHLRCVRPLVIAPDGVIMA